jgi:hypothetical protein
MIQPLCMLGLLYLIKFMGFYEDVFWYVYHTQFSREPITDSGATLIALQQAVSRMEPTWCHLGPTWIIRPRFHDSWV